MTTTNHTTAKPIDAIPTLWLLGGTLTLVGIVLLVVSFMVGSGYDVTATDLAGRIILASFAGVAFTVGMLSAIAALIVTGVRDIARRTQSGQPL